MKKFVSKLLAALLTMTLLIPSGVLSVSAAAGDSGSPSGAPAVPALTHNNWDGSSSYTLTFNIWWGNNATSYKLYENGVSQQTGALNANSPNAQSQSFSFQNKANGIYVYKLELSNSFGTSVSNELAVTVTKGPTSPVDPPAGTVLAPVFSLAAGTYTSPQNVSLSCATAGAVIRYTTDGSEPTASSTQFTAAIKVDVTSTLKAKAFKDGMNASSTVSASYVIKTGVEPPVTVSEWKIGAAYKKGDVVSYNGKNYECRLDHTALDGWQPSNVPALWQEYNGQVTPPLEVVASPVFTPAAGTYSAAQSVTLSCATAGAVIRYTTDGSEPTSASAQYTAAIKVDASVTLKAKAFKAGMTDSAAVTSAYVIQLPQPGTVAMPVFSPAGGVYASALNVTLSCPTAGAVIRYTTDGSEPTSASAQYTAAVKVTASTTLKAKAFKDGMTASATATTQYIIGAPAASDLPAHILTGYWQNFDNGAKCLKIKDVPLQYNLIAVAFADATTTPGAVDFKLDSGLSKALGGYTEEEFIQDIAVAKARGQKVIISVGGQNGTISVANEASAKNFADSICKLIDKYGFEGVDIDLENGVNPTYMGSALRQISQKVGPKLIIAMAPQTIDMLNPTTGYFKLALDIKDILTVVNTQFYNSGSMPGYDQKIYSQGSVDFLTALATTQLENGLRPDQVGLGLPASPSGAGGGYMDPSMVNTALNCLATGSKGGSFTPPKTYPGLRGAMNWSINWDASSGYKFANTVAPVLANLPGGSTPPAKESVYPPVPSPAGGTYSATQYVTLTCETAGAVIRYTTDGKEPTASSKQYTGPIEISASTTLKAQAFKSGMEDSAYTMATYVIDTKPVDPVDPTPTTGLQKRLLIGYWHTWGTSGSIGVPFVKLRDVDPNWDVINVAFAEPVSAGSIDGRMKFGLSGDTGAYTLDNFKMDVKILQSQGKKIVLSIGGYEGYFSLPSDAAIKQFVSQIKGMVDEYGFDGIDIDLEQSSATLNSGKDPDFRNPTSPKVVNMISAIRQICDSYGKNFILSWAPETFYMQMGSQFYAGLNSNCDERAGVYLPMINALRDKTTYVHVQLYNSIAITAPDGNTYSMGNDKAIVAMCKMLLDGFNVGGKSEYFFEPLRPDQVVIGVPSSAGAAGSGQVSNAQLQQAFSQLIAKYPDLRGIMAWSINWDAYQNSSSFAQSNGKYLDSTM